MHRQQNDLSRTPAGFIAALSLFHVSLISSVHHNRFVRHFVPLPMLSNTQMDHITQPPTRTESCAIGKNGHQSVGRGGGAAPIRTTHQSWGRSCRRLRSSCPVRPGRRIRPAAEPEGEGVRSGFHYPQAHDLLDHCHCSFLASHRGGEM